MKLPAADVTVELKDAEWFRDARHAAELADSVWVPAYPDQKPGSFFSRDKFLERLPMYLDTPGFVAPLVRGPVGAEGTRLLVGFAYAGELPANSRWMSEIRDVRGPGRGKPLSPEYLEAGTLAIRDVIVHPDWQGQRLGRLLHDAIVLAPQTLYVKRVTTLLKPEDTAMRAALSRAYKQVGWTYPFGEEYVAYVLDAVKYRREHAARTLPDAVARRRRPSTGARSTPRAPGKRGQQEGAPARPLTRRPA